MRFKRIPKPLFVSCLAVSMALHAGAFYYFYHNPAEIDRSEFMGASEEKAHPRAIPLIQEEVLISRIERALEESLNQLAAVQYDESSPTQNYAYANSYEEKEEDFALPPLFDPERSVSLCNYALDDEIESPFEHKFEKYASVDLMDPLLRTGLPESIMESAFEESDEEIEEFEAHPTLVGKKFEYSLSSDLSILTTPTEAEQSSDKVPFEKIQESTIPRLVTVSAVDYLRDKWVERTLAEPTLPSFEHYGIQELTGSIDWDEEIASEVSYVQDPESGRYIFSVTLHPEVNQNAEKLPQHFYFVIDRSHSMEKQKMSRFNRAVGRALAALDEEDHFNIVMFDKHIERFSEKELTANSKNIQRAQDFLDRQQAKPTSSNQPYTSLDKILPERMNKDEVYSVILISDGNALLGDARQKKTMAEWFKTSEGNVNFYTATSGKDNNLPILDLLSQGTAGKLLYSDTNAGFPRKLVRLVKDLHDPLVKNVTVDAITRDSNAKITLAGTQNTPLPPMFASKPYTLIGTIDELCDFTLLIQGKSGEHQINIKKEISLKDAKLGGRSLTKAWATSKAAVCYEKFLETGKKIHLKEAKEIVAPYDGIISSE